MTGSSHQNESVVHKRSEFGEFSESLLLGPALEEEITIQIIHDFVAAHDDIDIVKAEDASVTINEHRDRITITFPENPNLLDLASVTNFFLEKDTSIHTKKLPQYRELLSEKINILSKMLYQLSLKHKKNVNETELVSQALLKFSYALRGDTMPSENDLLQELKEVEIDDPDREFFVWFFLGGRDSSAYERLYQKYWEGQMTNRENNWERSALERELKTVDTSGEISEEIQAKKSRLLSLLVGPTEEDFEDYLLRKKSFLEKVTLDYLGGARTTQGLTDSVQIAITQDFKQAIWAQGINKLMKRIKPESELTMTLKDIRDFLKKFTQGRKNVLSAIPQNLLDRLPSIIDKIDMPTRFTQLDKQRQDYNNGLISADELVEYEEKWLEELHQVFKIPYDYSTKLLTRNPSGIDPVGGFRADYREVDVLKCRYQAEVHGFILMRAFGVYSAGFDQHQAILVQKSDGSYSVFDNSGWNLVHLKKELVPPYSVEKNLNNNPEAPVVNFSKPIELSKGHEVTDVSYFPETFFESVNSESIKDSGYKTRFDRTRSTRKGSDFKYSGISKFGRRRIFSYLDGKRKKPGINFSEFERKFLRSEFPQ